MSYLSVMDLMQSYVGEGIFLLFIAGLVGIPILLFWLLQRKHNKHAEKHLANVKLNSNKSKKVWQRVKQKVDQATVLGNQGEIEVQEELERVSKINKNEYTLYHDIYAPIPNGFSQIDHLIVTNEGVFVLETKNYKGWIYGEENAEYWTQVLYKRKEKLKNPIKQNFGHIQALKAWLGKELEQVPVYSVIVFTRRAELKCKQVYSDAIVVHPDQLETVFMQYQNTVETKLDVETKRAVINKLDLLESLNKHSKEEIEKSHIETVQQNIERYKQQIADGKCPRCGSPLVERVGKYGEFKGCSSFPQCRFKVS